MTKLPIDYEDMETDIQIQRSLEEDMETLCGKPHNNGDNRPEGCGGECMAIKLGI